MYLHIHINKSTNEMNDTRDKGKKSELLLFCCYKGLILPVKWYSII